MRVAAIALMLASSAVGLHAADDPAALARAGTAAIENRRFGDALDAFTRAAALQPADASLSFGVGVAAFMLGQNDVAQARFERALALEPTFLPAAEWLGDLHYRAGRLDEAISTYEAARRRSPDARKLHGPLALWRKERALHRRFHQMYSERFTVLFERATDEPRARAILERLEAAYWRVGSTLGVYPSQPVTVVLYTRKQFDEITGLNRWSVAAYDGRIRVPLGGGLEEPAELDRVLSHEFVHAVVATVGGRSVPAWVNEGLATVLETAGEEGAEAALAMGKARPALSTLHRSFVDLSRPDAEIAYASAALAVRQLIEQRGTAAVVALLEDLAQGASFASAFERRIEMPYETFSERVSRD